MCVFWEICKKILLIPSTILTLGGQTDKMIFLLVFQSIMCHVMSGYPEAILRLHVERRLEEMIPKQIVCIDLISPVLRNWLDFHTFDLFTTNVFAWRRCSLQIKTLVKSSLWFDWFNGFRYRTFSRCTVGRKTVRCRTLGRKKFGRQITRTDF